MEIKKEDFVRFRIVNTIFYALPVSYFDEKEDEVIEEVIEVEIVEIEEKPTKEELAAITKASKIAEMKAELAKLEE